MGESDPCLGIHWHVRAGNTSALEPVVSGKGSFVFCWKGTPGHVLFLVGFSSLCYGMSTGMVVDPGDNEAVQGVSPC